MTVQYLESKKADLSQRIVTADTCRKLAQQKGKFIEVKYWVQEEARLQSERLKVMEELEKTNESYNV